MTHGGLGYLNKEGVLSMPPELLEHALVQRGSTVYGLYYPKPVREDTDRSDEYENVRMRHDLMLAPIPHHRWDRAGRIMLYIKHQPERIREVSQYLASQKVSIVQSESTRSAYRYEIWSFYVVVEEIDSGEYDRNANAYRGTIKRLKEIERGLLEFCQGALFYEPYSVEREDGNSATEEGPPLVVKANTSLAYFHYVMKQAEARNRPSKPPWMYKPLRFRCKGPGVLDPFPEDPFTSILKAEEHGTTQSFEEQRVLTGKPMKLLPSIFYASMDTRFLTIRVSIIPEHLRWQFFELRASYRRIGEPNSSRGLVATFAQHLPTNYNIWSMVHSTLWSTDEAERGQVVMIIEDQNIIHDCSEPTQFRERGLHPSEEHCVAIARDLFANWEGTRRIDLDGAQHHAGSGATGTADAGTADAGTADAGTADAGTADAGTADAGTAGKSAMIEFDQPIITALKPHRIRRRIAQTQEMRGTPEVFLSYSDQDRPAALRIHGVLRRVGLDVFMADRSKEGGADFSEKIRNKLVNCREVWVLCTKHSSESEWVHTEWGAAWAMGKRIVPLINTDTSVKDLPPRLQMRQVVLVDELEHYAKQALIRIDAGSVG